MNVNGERIKFDSWVGYWYGFLLYELGIFSVCKKSVWICVWFL